MTSIDRAFESALRDWLEAGSDLVADETLAAVRHTVRNTRQERPPAGLPSLRLARPRPQANAFAALVAVLAIAIVATALGLGALSRVGGPPSPAPSTSSPPSPSDSEPPRTHASATSIAPMAPMGFSGSGTIAFTRHEVGSDEESTWLVDPGGQREARLIVETGWGGATTLPGSGCCVLFAPDGRSLVVGYDEVNPARGKGVLRTATRLALDGQWIGWVPEFCGGCASIEGINYVGRAWSADGHWLAVEVWSDADPSRSGIHLAPYGTGRPGELDWTTQVTGEHRDVPVAFSPDGRELLFVRLATDDRRGSLMSLTVAEGRVRAITADGELVFADEFFGPAASWSSDGTRIAYAATDSTGNPRSMRVWSVDRDGSNRVALTDPASFVTSARFSPDGAWIAFDRASSSSGLHDQWIIRPDGSELTNLTADFGPGVCCGRWSPEGTALVVAGTRGETDSSELLIIPITGGPVRQVTGHPGQYSDIEWGPATR